MKIKHPKALRLVSMKKVEEL